MKNSGGLLLAIYSLVLIGVVAISLYSLSLSVQSRARGVKNHELICLIAKQHHIAKTVLTKDC